MSKPLTIKILNNYSSTNINEYIKQIEAKLPNTNIEPTEEQKAKIKEFTNYIKDQKVPNSPSFHEAITSYGNAKSKLMQTINEFLPNTDAEKFINVLFEIPLSSGTLNLEILDKVFTLLEVKYGHSDLRGTLTVRQPSRVKRFITKYLTTELLVETAVNIMVSLALMIPSALSHDTENIMKHVDQIESNLKNEINYQTLIIKSEIKNDSKITHQQINDIEEKINEILENQKKLLNDNE